MKSYSLRYFFTMPRMCHDNVSKPFLFYFILFSITKISHYGDKKNGKFWFSQCNTFAKEGRFAKVFVG